MAAWRVKIKRLEQIPRNLDVYINEVAVGWESVFGTQAAKEYKQIARTHMELALFHPDMLAFAAYTDPISERRQKPMGMLWVARTDNVGRITFLHVLNKPGCDRVAVRLVGESVKILREQSLAGIVCDSIRFSAACEDIPFQRAGFQGLPRCVMGASLDRAGEGQNSDGTIPFLTSEEDLDAARVLLDAYQDHSDKKLYTEVSTMASALKFIQNVRQGNFGRVEDSFLLKARYREKLAGIALGSEFMAGIGFVLQLAVIPRLQKNCLGKQLFTRLLHSFRVAGLRKVVLGVSRDNPARGFYEKMGLKEIWPTTAYYWWNTEYGNPNN